MLGQARLQTIIWTSRIAEAELFYSDVLGLPLRGRSDGALLYDVNGADLRVSPVPATQASAHTVMGFAVPRLERVIAELEKRGVRREEFPHLRRDALGVVTTPAGARVVWFRDPDGNLLSIVQLP